MIAGLTGGMGSGKSIVARLLEMFGCAVFYSDEAGRSVYYLEDVRVQVQDLLGKTSYMASGEIDRKFISAKVFADRKLLDALNAIIHPAVGELFRQFVQRHPGRVIIKESALLFEAGITSGLDKIIVVAAPDEERIRRVMERDKLSRDEVQARMRSQLPQEEKVARADFVIHNNEGQLLITQVQSIFTKLNGR